MAVINFDKIGNKAKVQEKDLREPLSPKKFKSNFYVSKFGEQLGRETNTGFMRIFRETSTNIAYDPDVKCCKKRTDLYGKIQGKNDR
jgi:hypothetical protein